MQPAPLCSRSDATAPLCSRSDATAPSMFSCVTWIICSWKSSPASKSTISSWLFLPEILISQTTSHFLHQNLPLHQVSAFNRPFPPSVFLFIRSLPSIDLFLNQVSSLNQIPYPPSDLYHLSESCLQSTLSLVRSLPSSRTAIPNQPHTKSSLQTSFFLQSPSSAPSCPSHCTVFLVYPINRPRARYSSHIRESRHHGCCQGFVHHTLKCSPRRICLAVSRVLGKLHGPH